MEPTVVSWSGGKDAAVALYELTSQAVQVTELLTTISASSRRSSMHGVRRQLYELQAESMGVPINLVTLPEEPSNDQYAAIMEHQMRRYAADGIRSITFGDLFLEDVRAYREQQLAHTSLTGCWPLWGMDTAEYVRKFLDLGFRAIVVAVDATHFDIEDTGQTLDESFLDRLPDTVDPAGEGGEFHTFVTNGPMFEKPLDVIIGDRVTREIGEGTTMHYCDLVPCP